MLQAMAAMHQLLIEQLVLVIPQVHLLQPDLTRGAHAQVVPAPVVRLSAVEAT